jgi:hypothetical protein
VAGTARNTATSLEAIVTVVVYVDPDVIVNAVFCAACAAAALNPTFGTDVMAVYR